MLILDPKITYLPHLGCIRNFQIRNVELKGGLRHFYAFTIYYLYAKKKKKKKKYQKSEKSNKLIMRKRCYRRKNRFELIGSSGKVGGPNSKTFKGAVTIKAVEYRILTFFFQFRFIYQ